MENLAVYDEDSGECKRRNCNLYHSFYRDLTGSKRNDQAFALFHRLAVDGSAAGQNVQDRKGLIHPEFVFVVYPDTGEREIRIPDQLFPVIVRRAAGLLDQGRCFVRALDHVLALLDVQRTGFAVLQTVVIIQAVGDIAALLDFQQDGACADGVHRARAM